MALDDIKKAILTEAQNTADQHKRNAQQKIEAIQKEWGKKIDERKQEIIATTRRKANQKIQQTQFKIQAQAQSQILDQKQQMISKVYKLALDKLAELDDAKYVELMEKLISDLPQGDGSLISVKGKEDLLKKALKKTGRKYEILSETINGKGGFIFKSKQIEANQTFNALVNNAKEQTFLAVTDKLFGNQN